MMLPSFRQIEQLQDVACGGCSASISIFTAPQWQEPLSIA
jgi:hypothetical protein